MESTDVVVVGSGASAAPIAFSLARAGVAVIVLEKGDWVPRDERCEDELAQLYHEIYRPSAETDPTIVKTPDGAVVSDASRVGQSFYTVGGGTVRYTGTSWRLRPKDFRKLSTYGPVAGTALVDWPLGYDDLESYYTQAELEIGISGKAGEDPTEPARSKDVLMPPLPQDHFQRRLFEAARGLGWHPFHIPLAIHSQGNKHTGGHTCMQCGWCSGFPCLFYAKSSVDNVIFPRAKKTGHFLLKTGLAVSRIKLDGKGRASGVEVISTRTGARDFIGARVVVLAASAVQTARLLLLSASGKFPRGLANSSGLVGHNLMFHIEAKCSATFDDIFPEGFYKKTGIHDFYFPEKDSRFINHRSIQSGSKAGPISFALSRPGYGAAFVRDLEDNFLRTQEVQCMAEDLPQDANRVVLSDTHKDPLGLPSPQIVHRYHADDRAAVASAVARIRQLLQAAGGKAIEAPETIQETIQGRYTWHLMGTCRMGRDPASSVVDPDLRSHDVPNLLIVDGSVFPTSGGLNPTLTMQALSFRAADRLLAAMKGGKL